MDSCYHCIPWLNLKIDACMRNTAYIHDTCICIHLCVHVTFLLSFSFNNLPSLSTMGVNWLIVFWNQNVSLARRFALVPLGPPLLAYCSNCKAMLTAVDGAVQLVVDRPYKAGDPIVVWYNSCFIWHHLLLNKDVVIFVLVASL